MIWMRNATLPQPLATENSTFGRRRHFIVSESGERRWTAMTWLVFALGAIISWGLYGPSLHRGQVQLRNPMRALLCVGIAYFLMGVLVPVVTLSYQGGLRGFNWDGTIAATVAGALGALGAICIIWAFKFGGVPTYVMPLV